MGSKNGKNAKNRNRKLIFQPEVPKKAYFRFRFLNFQGFTLLFWQKVGRIWPFLANFLGISTGSSSISAGSGPKSADFSKFSRLHALCGKKFWKFDLDLLKIPIFFIKFLKRFRYRSEKLAQKRSKKGELGSNLT